MRTAWLDQVSTKDSLFTSTSCVLKGYKQDDQKIEKNVYVDFILYRCMWIDIITTSKLDRICNGKTQYH